MALCFRLFNIQLHQCSIAVNLIVSLPNVWTDNANHTAAIQMNRTKY